MASQQFLALEARHRQGDAAAAAAIVALAEARDPDALFKAAEFRLTGTAGPVDTEEAWRLMTRAAAAGLPEARRAQAYFTAAGLGRSADLAEARRMLEAMAPDDRYVQIQLAFLEHVGCAARLQHVERRLLSEDPHVELIPSLFSPHECRYIRQLAAPSLEPAMIMGARGGVRDPHRDSDNAVITPMAEDLVVQAVNRCIAEASGTGYSWGEPLHILRYRPGQQYRRHHDAHAFGPVRERRIATALLYLNDDYDGGETEFPQLGFKVQAGTGDLLIFHNLTADKLPDPRMMHAGLPVTRGEKWVATRWIRGGDYFGRGQTGSAFRRGRRGASARGGRAGSSCGGEMRAIHV